ncbi:MAG: ABC transporter ATP-binding protein, partial [Gemmatimonadetes bacterium]|nr:ABC transporter ATP-binding protein [Gemmatimonadota bacterium]
RGEERAGPAAAPRSSVPEVGVGEAFRGLLPLLGEHKRALAVCVGLLLSVTGFSLAWPWIVQHTIDGPLATQRALPEAARSFRGIFMLGGAVLVIQAVTLVFQYQLRVRLETIGQAIMLGLRKKLFDHIVNQDMSFFDELPVGKLLSRVESDTESLRQLFTNAVVVILGDVLLIGGIWGVMFYKAPRLAAVLLVTLPAVALLFWAFHKLTTDRFFEVRKRTADLTATLTEMIHGIGVIQIFDRERYARKRVFESSESKFAVQSVTEVMAIVFFNVLFWTEYVKIALLLWFGSTWGVSPGIIVLFLLLIWKEFEPIGRTAEQLSSFQKGIAGGRRIFGLLKRAPKITNPAPGEAAAWNGIRSEVRFENVTFSYDGKHQVLKNVSFALAAGTTTALVGVTGGGKSTIISLLFRFYDPQEGRITIDGVDIRSFELSELRTRLALVLQDIVLFPGDVRSNISLEAPAITEEDVRGAALTVNVDPFIQSLPQGYDTEVSEKGANFSRGERQLLSFARALVTDPELLILDEATASVDPETERAIQGAMGQLVSGRTSLVIAHRLSTIVHADQILVLREGEIIERGAHRDLLGQGGYYAELYELQFEKEGSAIHEPK